MSKYGIAFCLVWLLVMPACFGMGITAGGDSKGQFVFAQLPIALQGSLAVSLGLGPTLEKLSWPAAYFFLSGPTFLVLYGLGWLITVARRALQPRRSRDGSPTA